jgi:hypothetical protein
MKNIKIILMLCLLINADSYISAQYSKTKKKATKHKVANIKKKNAVQQKSKNVKNKKKELSKKSTQKLNNNPPPKANTIAFEKTPIINIQSNKEEVTDTIETKVVVVTSEFKPSLQNAAKINFTAATPLSDAVIIPLTYKVPSSSLFFSYQPISIQPLALPNATLATWQNTQRIKVGAGNYNTILGEGKFSFGDGKHNITTIQADFINAKGDQFAQEISKFNLDAASIINTQNNLEWTPHLMFNSTTQNLYGYQPASLVYSKDELRQTFNKVGLEIGFRNKIPNAANINFNPILSFYRFTDILKGAENNLILKAPLTKSFGEHFAFHLGLTADVSDTKFTNYSLKNQLFLVNPALLFSYSNIKLNIGVQPSWDNNIYSMQPDISAEVKIKGTAIALEGGWKGYFTKNNYRTLFDFNPWISQLTSLHNTAINEQYAGIKGDVGNHISYNARASFLKLKYQPLFYNNFNDGKTFVTTFAPEIEAFKIHGELKYAVQESFSLLSSINATQFNVISSEDKPWGLIPFEITGSGLWKPFKDLQVKADIFYKEGSLYRNPSNSNRSDRLSATVDLNLSAEFNILNNLNMWVQMNNIFNNKYQRWNQYPVFGFNVMAGIVYSFK